ncbi:hypothetical protein ACTXT7_000326 [Hymenolepis weldensis]
MPESENGISLPNRIGPSLMLNSVYLENSSSDIFIEDSCTPSSTEPLVLQKRRKALRYRLLSRSQQPLTDSSSQNPPERFEIDIKGRGLEVGKIHSSLVGGRKNCFFIKMPTRDTRIFAAASQGERKCWLTRRDWRRSNEMDNFGLLEESFDCLVAIVVHCSVEFVDNCVVNVIMLTCP